MRIAFLWTGFTSYMADCWRELVAREGVELKLWIEEVRKSDTGFDPTSLMEGLDFRWTFSDQIDEVSKGRTESEIAAFAPDLLFICGWARKLPPSIAASRLLADVPKVLCCDMPWEWTLRKFAARFVLRCRLRRFRKILVPGERAAMYARWLGFRPADIVRGEYGVDTARFEQVQPADARHGFVFIGRLVPEKGIRTLVEAYRRYRAAGGDWPLDVYGIGDEAECLEGQEGLVVHGFVQPVDLPRIYARARVLLLPSTWEPWGVVMLEAAAAGLPIICTDRCWGRCELVRENGLVVRSGDPAALAQAMWRARTLDGTCGRRLADAFSATQWANRILCIARELSGGA